MNHQDHLKILFDYLNGNSSINKFKGEVDVENGLLLNNISIIHARSIAEDVIIYDNSMNRFTGEMNIIDGKLQENLIVEGKSLVHSAPLTALAFDIGFLGNYGNYIVSIGLTI